jgi:hypothetical protein
MGNSGWMRERERELADGLKLDMKTPPKHESQKKSKQKIGKLENVLRVFNSYKIGERKRRVDLKNKLFFSPSFFFNDHYAKCVAAATAAAAHAHPSPVIKCLLPRDTNIHVWWALCWLVVLFDLLPLV